MQYNAHICVDFSNQFRLSVCYSKTQYQVKHHGAKQCNSILDCSIQQFGYVVDSKQIEVWNVKKCQDLLLLKERNSFNFHLPNAEFKWVYRISILMHYYYNSSATDTIHAGLGLVDQF